jgi:hypothetical protein
MIAVASLAVAVQAARHADAESTRGPTPAELAAAAKAALAQRWERLPASQVFPATIGYRTDQRTTETAARLGFGPALPCGQALDVTLQGAARAAGCAGVLRADYADELSGTVYTVGVVAFPDDAAARQFAGAVRPDAYPATGLRALMLPQTAAALFTDPARQSAVVKVTGPYVVLAVAGYADGRPASTVAERRDSVFSPASQLATVVAAPLALPQRVSCGTTEFTC